MLRQAVILAGGFGTRLGERTELVSTPLAEVAGRPFLDFVLDEVARYPTIRDILLLAGHSAEAVASRYHGTRRRHASISVLPGPVSLGSAGALRHAAPSLHPQFLLLNGNRFFDFNLLDLAMCGSSSIVRAALRRDHPDDRYGRVQLEGDTVKGFLTAGSATSGPISSGVYAIRREILDFIEATPGSLEQSVFPRLVEKAQLRASLYDGFFIDVGNPADLERAQAELPARLRRPAVFFDRDGVLNVDKAYVHEIGDFEWIPGAREAIKLCNDQGYLTFVVTNQSGVARGYYGVDAVERLHGWMNDELAQIGAHIDEFQYCPYHEEGVVEQWRQTSDRRKPAPGMIIDCLKGWPVEKDSSLLIGDRLNDLEAAARAGIVGHLFEGGDLAAFLRPRLRAGV